MGKKEQIGIRIRTMRKSRRMTQEDLARSIGQSASSITMYETGRRSPDYETLEAFADIFNVPISALVSDLDDSFYDRYSAFILKNLSEQDLVEAYRSLTPRGQELLIERAKELKLLYGKKSEDNSAESV